MWYTIGHIAEERTSYTRQWRDHGFRLFTERELRSRQSKLVKQIRIGTSRQGDPTEADGGLLAFRTGVNPITPEEWAAVPVGCRVISCDFAGTNWRTSLVKKAADGKPAKFWHITDWIKPEGGLKDHSQLIGKALLNKLNEKGYSTSKIFILNDTNALASYTVDQNNGGKGRKIPGSLVAGTGTNMSMKEFNLEAGRAKREQDPLSTLMRKKIWEGNKSLIPEGDGDMIEHFTGGDYIKYRLAAAIKLLLCLINSLPVSNEAINQVIGSILASQDQAVVSKLSKGEIDKTFGEDKEVVKGMLTKGAWLALGIAGQSLGIMIASLVKALELEAGDYWLPIQGGVIEKAYNVQQIVQETLKTLLPEFNIRLAPGSGLIGIAQLAMAKGVERLSH